jgi:Fe-Mn family superoxide dismutase
MVETSFGSIDALKKELAAAAVSQFGSGWTWLVLVDGKLKVIKTANAENPLSTGKKPRLSIDVWEHAYKVNDWVIVIPAATLIFIVLFWLERAGL